MQLEPVFGSEPDAGATPDAQAPSDAIVQDAAQHHASSKSLAMPVAAKHTQAEHLQDFPGAQFTVCEPSSFSLLDHLDKILFVDVWKGWMCLKYHG